MKKQFKLDEIDCANCARKLQDELAKLEGVKSVSVNFMTQKLTLEADDAEFDEVLDRVVEFTASPSPGDTCLNTAFAPSRTSVASSPQTYAQSAPSML